MIKLENVLVATDFSEPSHTAMEYGRTLARQFGATLHVVHIERGFQHAGEGRGGLLGHGPILGPAGATAQAPPWR